MRTRSIRALLCRLCPLFAVGMSFTPVASAHHSPASFDTKQTITVTGTISKVYWANPHVYVYVEETTSDGKKIEWEIECFPPMVLRRMGWVKDTLAFGDAMIVTGNPAKNSNSKEIFPSLIVHAGKPLFAMQDAIKKFTNPDALPPAVTAAKGMNGVWTGVMSMLELQKSMGPDVPNLTKEGVDALKRFDEKTAPATSCIAAPPPWSMLIPDLKRLTATNGAIVIEGEYDNSKRTLHLDASSHTGAIASLQGHSIGRWEGKTLVVDTANFAYHGTGNGGGFAGAVPSSTQKHLVERFTLGDDGKSLSYSYELTDPAFLKAPRVGSFQWRFMPGEKFVSEPCSLESARQFIKQ